MTTRVLPDANVLYSRTLRDWVFMLRLELPDELFRVYYTEDIMAEVINTIRRRNPGRNGRDITAIHDRICALRPVR